MNAKCIGCVSLLMFGFMLAGCNASRHMEPSIEAQQRWNAIRAGVKAQLASRSFEHGYFEESIEAANASINLDPKSPAAYELMTKAYLELDRPVSAQQVLDGAEIAQVISPLLSYLQGVILEQRDALEDALSNYQHARQQDDSVVDFVVAEAECLVALGRLSEAGELLDQFATRFDQSATVHMLGAYVATLVGDAGDALDRYAKAYARLGDSPMIARAYGLSLAKAGRKVEALSILEPLAAGDATGETYGKVRCAIARCYLADGKYTRAKNILYRYALVHADDLEAQILLAKAALATGDVRSSLRAAKAASQIDAGSLEVLLLRGLAAWKSGRVQEGVELLQQVLERNGADLDARCALASIFRRQERWSEVQIQIEEILTIDADHAWAKSALAELTDLDEQLSVAPAQTNALPALR